MSDFLLDFAPPQERHTDHACSFLRFFPDIHVLRIEEDAFSLVLALNGDPAFWGPYRSVDGTVLDALVGRTAMEDAEWEQANEVPGAGGLASKAIYRLYRNGGIGSLARLNGSYVAMVYDASVRRFFLVGDRGGMTPLFRIDSETRAPVFSTHPDLLSTFLAHRQDYDLTSLCEFLMTGKVSYPFTYYKGISAADYASIHTVDLGSHVPVYRAPARYFHFDFKPCERGSDSELVEKLSAAIKNAVRRRTLSRLGPVAIGLSGGLDSRMILCACPDLSRVTTFCFYDEQNAEYRTAREIADAKGVPLIPLKREFEHYGNSAEAGVRICGGMSSLAANHYLGFRPQLSGGDFRNILTGLYCDYLLKGLALNRTKGSFSVNEKISQFCLEWYLPFFPVRTAEGRNVEERLETVFPRWLRESDTDNGRLEIECRRLFPLCYEPENIEVLVPEKVLGWYLPVIDNEVLDIYLTIPPRFKVDHSLYAKVVQMICGRKVSMIRNCNTGASVKASPMTQLLHRYARSVRKRFRQYAVAPGLATDNSWPDFEFYIHQSPLLRDLWTRKNAEATDLFRRLLSRDLSERPIAEYRGEDWHLFARLLTLKVWLDAKVPVTG